MCGYMLTREFHPTAPGVKIQFISMAIFQQYMTLTCWLTPILWLRTHIRIQKCACLHVTVLYFQIAYNYEVLHRKPSICDDCWCQYFYILSLVWRGHWPGIEPGTSGTWSQHYTTRLSRRQFLKCWFHTNVIYIYTSI